MESFGFISEKLKKNEKLKLFVLNLLVNPIRTRPRLWLRLLRPLYIKKGHRSVLCSSVRKDIVPFNKFIIGRNSVVEDYATVNNMVGDIEIGDNTRIGIGNVIIGPVSIGNNVNLAQNVTVSGLDHNYEDVNSSIASQGVSTAQIVIEEDVWVGANSVITKGIRISSHSVVAACSLVNKDVPPFSIVGGNPAKLLKQYSKESGKWERVL
ncbi:MAG: acyltransferase [Rikenellaceae bacterium]|nr:acyltransferase [Rikenellaceae bacterium]